MDVSASRQYQLVQSLERRTLLSLTGPLFPQEGVIYEAAAGTFLTGDFDGNGLPDTLAGVTALSPYTLTAHFNIGNGQFRSLQTSIGTGSPSSPSTTVADFNADGRSDVFAIDGGSGKIWAGNANGTFSLYSTVTLPTSYRYVTAADLDADGKLDLVFLGASAANRVGILYGTGPGQFAPPVYIASSSTNAISEGTIVCVDVNADGQLDIVRNELTSVAVHLNLGARQFSTPTLLAYNGYNMAVADVTSDGLPDVIGPFGASSTGSTRIWRNLGNGQFEVQSDVLATQGSSINDLRIADFDRDGRNDLVLTRVGSSSTTEKTEIHFGRGDGTFAQSPTVGTLPFGNRIVPVDVNQDGSLDLIVESAGKLSFFPVLSDSPGRFPALPTIADQDNSESTVVADFNEDGHLDVVALGGVSTSVMDRLYLGNGDGSFVLHPGVNLGSSDRGEAADVNGDGHQDLIVWTVISVRVLLGSGTGTFTEMWRANRGSPREIAIADFNRDGKIDFAVTSTSSATTINLYNGIGDGTFSAGANLSTGNIAISSIAAGDVNNDGFVDVAASLDFALKIFLGDGNGTFTAALNAIPILAHFNLVIEDFDRDGVNDLIVARQNLEFRKGLGDGTFGPRVQLLPNLGFGHIEMTDLDLDGWTDIVASQGLIVPSGSGSGFIASLSPEIAIVRYDGQKFTTTPVATRAHAWAIAIGDVNEDGKPDIITSATRGPMTLSVLLNQGMDSTAPSLVSTSIDIDSRTVTFVFDRQIDWNTIGASDLKITRLGTGQTYAATRFTQSGDGRTMTFQLPISLPDGDYRFAIEPGSILSLAGAALSNAAQLPAEQSYILAGDVNRDRSVNFDDLLTLAQNYGQSGRTFSQGNLNYSAEGLVNFDDLLILAQWYGTSLTAPAGTTVRVAKKTARRDVLGSGEMSVL